MAGIQKVRDWDSIRKAYVEAEERPTYAELSERFSAPLSTICNAAADQGCVMMRAARIQAELARAEIGQVLISAAKDESVITSHLRSVVLVTLKDSLADLEAIRTSGKPSSRVGLRNTISFTVANLTQALKNMGVGALPKEIRERLAGEPSGDNWKGAMRDLNVMLKVDVGGSGPTKVTEITATPKA